MMKRLTSAVAVCYMHAVVHVLRTELLVVIGESQGTIDDELRRIFVEALEAMHVTRHT